MDRQKTILSQYGNKKIRGKKKLVQVLNPLVQNHIRARVVDFFIAGHIYSMAMQLLLLEKKIAGKIFTNESKREKLVKISSYMVFILYIFMSLFPGPFLC